MCLTRSLSSSDPPVILQLPAEPPETILTPTEPLAKPNPQPMSTKNDPSEATTSPQQTCAAPLVPKIEDRIQKSGSEPETILILTEPPTETRPDSRSADVKLFFTTVPEVARGQDAVQDSGSEFSPERKAAINPKACDGAELVVQNQMVDDPPLGSGLDSKAGGQGYDGTEVGPSTRAERKKRHTGRVQPSQLTPAMTSACVIRADVCSAGLGPKARTRRDCVSH